MEGSGEAVETSSEGQHGGAQGAADQVRGVCTDIAAFVVGVDCQVEAHQLDKVLVFTVSKHVGQVEAVIFVLLNRGDLAIFVHVTVDPGCDGGELGDQVHRVLECVLPVFLLVDTLGVGFGESRLLFKGVDSKRELSHRVKVAWAAVEKLLDEFRHVGPGSPFGGQATNLLFAGDLSSQEQPEKT